ncbi:MAG: beta-N-acetylhexosaminidase [Acidobacteria bacterium]|nr:beta-N-acetylhexosaminidase [Acidobacteriota bacterium]
MPRYLLVCTAAAVFAANAAEPTALFLRGHAVLPAPQRVSLKPGDVSLATPWRIQAPSGIARRTLEAGLKANFTVDSPSFISLRTAPGAIDAAPAEVSSQAYKLTVAPGRIEIIGNGEAGLFYGVQTLLQLAAGNTLPECEIEDWPRLNLRFLHWDTKHHQDRMETLKRYLDWAARFKVNTIGFELEDKFSYPSNPIIGAPGAFTPAELQELVNYGLERYIQIVPIVQSPAHFAYVLKHPQFAHLRADGNNYSSDTCREDTYKLIFQMYDDLIAATKGIDYFFVSTDENYYAGIGSACTLPYNPANRSAEWANFAIRAHDHLAARGRRMLAWLEYPLLAKDLERIPADVIDGVVGDDSFVDIEMRKGMRQLIYVSMQGAEFLFPDHFAIESLPPGVVMGEFEEVFTAGRLTAAFHTFNTARAMRMNPIGAFGAAWGDSGLHNESFWLGWSAVAAWAWHPGSPTPEQQAAEFMRIYYGGHTAGLVEDYRALQRQARAWQRTWDRVTSRARKPGYGNSEGPGIGTARQDLTLELPVLPDPATLAFQPRFAARYKGYLGEASALALQNDQLVHSLLEAMLNVERNRYNLEMMLVLARFTGHHWQLFSALAGAEKDLSAAAAAAAKGQHAQAVGHLVAAHNKAQSASTNGEAVFAQVVAAWEKSQWPKGREVNGRKFIHVLDDTKDHLADRTPGLGYMAAAERSLALPRWCADLSKLTRAYAAAHNVPVRGLADARLEE